MNEEKNINRIETYDDFNKVEPVMRKSNYKKIVVVLSVVIAFVLGFTISSITTTNKVVVDSNDSSNESFETQKAKAIFNILNNDWYFSSGKDNLIDNAIKGMTVSDKDTHTTYMSTKEAGSMLGMLNSDFVGIGIQYKQSGDYYVVEAVYTDSPADKAGIKVGDIIKKVDGTSIKNVSSDKISEMIRGKKGEKVVITVERDNKEKEYSMERDEIDTSTLGSIEDGVGILKLETFGDDTAKEVEANLKRFKEKKVKKIIIDLRNNGGGYVETAIDIASLFVDTGKPVLYQKNKDGDLEVYRARDKEKYHFDKIGILVNQNTASASEILTACLKKYTNVTLVGTKTYGKGTVQNTKQFKDGSMLKYTIAEWLTPDKECINGVGINPDYVVELDPAISYIPSNDAQKKNATKSYKYDQVGNLVRDAQVYLEFLGYKVDRTDGYYSKKCEKAVKKFQKDNDLKQNGIIDINLIANLQAKSSQYWAKNIKKLDTQKNKMLKILNKK